MVLDMMEPPFVTSKGMKELLIEHTTEAEQPREPGAKVWEAKVEWATESIDPEVRAVSYYMGRILVDRKYSSLLPGMAWVL